MDFLCTTKLSPSTQYAVWFSLQALQMRVVAIVDKPEPWRAALIELSPREPALNAVDEPCPTTHSVGVLSWAGAVVGSRSATPEAVGTTVVWTRTVSPTSLWHHPVEPYLSQHSSQDAKGRESIKLESSPTEGEGIHCPRLRFRFPGHKWGKLAVQSACKEVNLWNKGEGRKLFEHHRVKHPFSIFRKIRGTKICHGVLNTRD